MLANPDAEMFLQLFFRLFRVQRPPQTTLCN
jgi:hypothetical protein